MRIQFAELSATENLHWNLLIILNHHFADFKTIEAVWSPDSLEFSNHCCSWSIFTAISPKEIYFTHGSVCCTISSEGTKVYRIPPTNLISPGLTGEETGDNVVFTAWGTSVSTPLAPQPNRRDYGVKLLVSPVAFQGSSVSHSKGGIRALFRILTAFHSL